ncbi:hypothetical protein BJ322DRAFT_793185 [Thelephora terrestris]|uniref:Uncharacterized protein n=1 Tax=Thelephora terrestris TaxID=56493 RepID=A0A9P6HE04_9AGAM|nr:hypothetical protein BJ322DRAFT_793185 [Thelephora terrestris]
MALRLLHPPIGTTVRWVAFETKYDQCVVVLQKAYKFILDHEKSIGAFVCDFGFSGPGSSRLLCNVNVAPFTVAHEIALRLDLNCDFRDPQHKDLRVSVTHLLTLLKTHPSLEDCQLTVYGEPMKERYAGPPPKVSLPQSLKKLRLTSERPLAGALFSGLASIPKDTKITFCTQDNDITIRAPDILKDTLPEGSFIHNAYIPAQGLQFLASRDKAVITLGNFTIEIKPGANPSRSNGEWCQRTQQILQRAVEGRQFTKLEVFLQEGTWFPAAYWRELVGNAPEVETMIYSCPNAQNFLAALAEPGVTGHSLQRITKLEFHGVEFVGETLSQLEKAIESRKTSGHPIKNITIHTFESKGEIYDYGKVSRLENSLKPEGILYLQFPRTQKRS